MGVSGCRGCLIEPGLNLADHILNSLRPLREFFVVHGVELLVGFADSDTSVQQVGTEPGMAWGIIERPVNAEQCFEEQFGALSNLTDLLLACQGSNLHGCLSLWQMVVQGRVVSARGPVWPRRMGLDALS